MPVQFYLTDAKFCVYACYTCQYFEKQRLSAQIKSLLTYLPINEILREMLKTYQCNGRA